jgi:hypothetical protein
MYKFPQNNLYSYNMIADSLRKIHISENRKNNCSKIDIHVPRCKSDPPPPLPHSKNLYLRQLRTNQNQLNTTGGQNLNEFNDTAGWLSGFCNELIKSSQPQITLPLPNQPEYKKGNCGNLDIHYDKYKNSKTFCYW